MEGTRSAAARSFAKQALLALALALALAPACNGGESPGDPTDASEESDAAQLPDATRPDSGDLDAGPSDSGEPADAGEVPDAGGLDAGDDADAGLADAETPCVPKYPSCDGLCGPVTDLCSGVHFECGACADPGKVCDLDTHRCVSPRTVDCTGHCGVMKDGCGVRHECGDCPAGQECDRVRNVCVTCSILGESAAEACADLGHECGLAWLGCGSQSELTDCGACPAGGTCNLSSHTCEPSCTPPAPADVCQARGAQCGFVSDGCGGNVDCGGCPQGTACGAHGIANRCDPIPRPFECTIAGHNCGELASACGGTVSCGECTDLSEVCNDGVCGPPCQPKTCDAPEYAGGCGVQLPNGCRGRIDCPCAAGLVCSTAATPGVAGLCAGPKQCADFSATGGPHAPCSNLESSAFPRGDGSNLRCTCDAGGTCLDATHQPVAGAESGTCCYNEAVCPPGVCGTSVADSCTGAPISCGCTAPGTHCDLILNACLLDATCADFSADGAESAPCSTGPNSGWPVGDGRLLTCNNCQSPGICKTSGTSVVGTCCVNHTVCAADACNTSVLNDCTGATVQCTCASGKHCERVIQGGTPVDKCLSNYTATCSTYTTGADGQRCSNAASPGFPKGDGTNLSCPCTGSNRHCLAVGGSTDVTGGTEGVCCTNANVCNGACNTTRTDSCTGATINCTCGGGSHCDTATSTCTVNNTCSGYSVGGAAGRDCSRGAVAAWDRGDGVGLTCGCNAGLICVDKATGHRLVNTTGEIGTCTAPKTCTDYSAGGAAGAACSVSAAPDFWKGDGTNLNCPCTGGRFCVTAAGAPVTGTATGTCCTNTAACAANSCAPVINSCNGATIACTCGTGKYCQSSDKTCQLYKTCTDYGAGGSSAGAPCSRAAASGWDRGDGNNLTCDCSGVLVCTDGTNLVSGTTKGTCQAKKTCTDYGATGAEGDACSTAANPSWQVGDGTTLTCNNCGAGLYCDGSTSTCLRKKSCADFSATGAEGAPCSHEYPEGGGGTIDCGCATGMLCTDGTQLATGSSVGACAAPKTCASFNASGAIGAPCSASATSAFPVGDGSGLQCPCGTTTTPNARCVDSTSTRAGTCRCTPTSCTVLGTGFHPNNGCGAPVTCGG